MTTEIRASKPCLFCVTNPVGEQCTQRQTLFEGIHWRVLMDYKPVTEGHLLIVPKEHRETRHDLTKKENNELFEIQVRIKEIYDRIYPDCSNMQYEKNGPKAWQHIDHFSIQVIPSALKTL